MKRTPLRQRLQWLKDGHEGDLEYNRKLILHVASMRMNQYFAGSTQLLETVRKALSCSPDIVANMTYMQMVTHIMRIRGRYYHDSNARDLIWALATPYYFRGKKECRANGEED